MKTSNRPDFRRAGAARRAQLLSVFDRSGLSAAAFARQYKLNYTTFCGWRQRRRAAKVPAFVQLEVTPPPAAGGLIVELGVARLRIESAAQIALAAQLVQQLNVARPC